MQPNPNIAGLGASITKAASLQTYYTVRLLVDRSLVEQAYQAYAYFRWVDDWLDEPARQRADRLRFVDRQRVLLDACDRRETVPGVTPQEFMLVDLIRHDQRGSSGLHLYIRNMMSVMAFDAERRGRLISAHELDRYQHCLAAAVTEALHYFIGHNAASPHGPARYLAAEGAHIVHMLRDTVEDTALGYFNIPREYLKAHGISPCDTHSAAYRAWVRSRVQQARACFLAGRIYLSQVESRRCRLAGYAYMARFETVLASIERDGYVLRPEYREARSTLAGAWLGWLVLCSAFNGRQGADQRELIPR